MELISSCVTAESSNAMLLSWRTLVFFLRTSQLLAIIKSQDLSSLLVPSSCQSLLVASYIYGSDDSTSSYRLVL